MKKYLLVAAAAVVASSSVQASEGLSGAYMGVRAGLTSTKVNHKNPGKAAVAEIPEVVGTGGTAGTPAVPGKPAVPASQSNFGTTGFAGDIVAGYGMLMDSFYLGGEAIIGFDGTNQNLTNNVKLKGGLSLGAAARFGYALTQKSMIYVSLGVSSEKVKITTSPTVKAKAKNLVAFVPGIGTQIAMTDAVAVRADFTYSLAKKLKIEDSSYQPKKAAFKVGVVYSF